MEQFGERIRRRSRNTPHRRRKKIYKKTLRTKKKIQQKALPRTHRHRIAYHHLYQSPRRKNVREEEVQIATIGREREIHRLQW